ncbi:MAG TPA: ATP-grasp domain-containing protein [Rickettsiales bacterium]|nr:ATP-grasp domain-containing protein [Rickettsiales bacterium]
MKQAKKVLLCDAAFSVLPILDALQERGYFVGVCGGRPEDPCHALADESLLVNYADIDRVAELFRQKEYDYIVPGCTDVSYVTSCHIANRFGRPGFNGLETLPLFQDKAAYRLNCLQNGIPAPAFTRSFEEAKGLHFPLLVKPVDSFSGRGIVKVGNPAELTQPQGGGEYIYEEFVEGKLYSHSAIIKGGRILIDFFVNEYCTVYPYQVNSSHVAVSLGEDVRRRIRQSMERFIAVNSLCDGLLHTQLIVNGGQFWLIEAARRCPGDLYSLLIHNATGINYADLYSRSFCREAVTLQKAQYEVRPISRHTVSVRKDGIFMCAGLNMPFKESSYISLRKTGEALKAAPYDRAGIYFLTHDSLERMETQTERLVDHVEIEMR